MEARYRAVLQRIRDAERRWNRPPDSVILLAASKAQPVERMRRLYDLGQRRFGENYVAEAMEKMQVLSAPDVEWHFIGPVQSNKTRTIAERFDWVHSVSREKIARRLSAQRQASGREPINACIQVNISGEATKSGVDPEGLERLALFCADLSGLRLRGLMAIPAPAPDFDTQLETFRRLAQLAQRLSKTGLELDTLSMGMTADLEAAVAAGANIVRVGTALFGPRRQPGTD